MPSFPKIGPDWSQLWDVVGKLAGDESLDSRERYWLTELLQESASGVDVSKRFTERRRASPKADRNFWIACDAEWCRVHDAGGDEKVLDRWPGLEFENLQKIKRKHRDDIAAIAAQVANPQFLRVLEWHRPRSKTGTNCTK